MMIDVDENVMTNDTKDDVKKDLKSVYDGHKQILALP